MTKKHWRTPTTLRRKMARSAIVAASLAVAAGSCNRSAPAEEPAEVEPVLVFSDDFERESFGEDWFAASETWTIQDGWVVGANARNEGLWLQVPLPEDVRLSFDAKALGEEGDLKFEIFTDGRTHQSGYVGIFGGWDNRLNIIARLDEHGDDRLVGAEGQHVEVDRVYRFEIERTGAEVIWRIDGADFITFDDAEPLTGEGHQFFGFNDWESPVRFDNVEVWDLSPE